MVTERPTIVESPPKRSRQRLAAMIATPAAPATSSPFTKTRPRLGLRPNVEKKLGVTAATGTRAGSPAPSNVAGYVR
jgi:hypothetical protein